jgi:hypothetical protein
MVGAAIYTYDLVFQSKWRATLTVVIPGHANGLGDRRDPKAGSFDKDTATKALDDAAPGTSGVQLHAKRVCAEIMVKQQTGAR